MRERQSQAALPFLERASYTGPLSATAGLAPPPSSWFASTGLSSNSKGHGHQRRSPSNAQVPCEDCGVCHEQWAKSSLVTWGAVQGLKSLGLSTRNTRFKSQLHPRTGKVQRTPLFGLACSLVGLRRSVPSFHRLLSPMLTSPWHLRSPSQGPSFSISFPSKLLYSAPVCVTWHRCGSQGTAL